VRVNPLYQSTITKQITASINGSCIVPNFLYNVTIVKEKSGSLYVEISYTVNFDIPRANDCVRVL